MTPRRVLNPSNPDRRLICRRCTPTRQIESPNWFSVYCPRCGEEATEEMTPGEHREIMLQLKLSPSAAPFRVKMRL